MKKDKISESKSKWSILLVTGKGKTYADSYVKVMILLLLSGFVISLVISFALGIVAFSLMDSNHILKLENEKLRTVTTAIEKENQELKQRVAFLSSLRQEPGESSSVKKLKEPISLKNNHALKKKDALAVSGSLKSSKYKPDNKLGASSAGDVNLDGMKFVEVRKFDLNKDDSSVIFSFEIMNTSKIKPLSGYIFVLLKGRNVKPENWIISPYSELKNQFPLHIDKGQFFSISRYKPVRIKFPFNDISSYDTAEILVFRKDSKLIFKKGFRIHEKKNT